MFDALRRSRQPVNGNRNGGSPADSGWGDPLAAASDRIQLIVEGANRVAAEVREEAETQAQRYVEEARRRAEDLTSERIRFIAETSNSLLEQGRMVKAQSDELVEALRQAALQINAAASELASPQAPAPMRAKPDKSEISGASPVAEWEPAETQPEPEPPADSAASEDPRLLATKMAVAGSSRRQVEARLRDIGVEDPVGLVDAAFRDV